MIKNVDTSVSTQTASQLAVLEPCIKQCQQTRSIRYNVLVADYQYSTATIHFVTLKEGKFDWELRIDVGRM